MNKKSTPRKDWREERRMRALELRKQGWKQKDIAEALGVSEGAVSQWMRDLRGNREWKLCAVTQVREERRN